MAAITFAISSAVVVQLGAGNDALDGPEREQFLRGDHRAHEEHRAQLVLRNEAGEVGRHAERTAIDFGQPEGRVVGGDHDVGVAREPDAATQAETVDRRDHRDRAVVDRAERFPTPTVDLHQALLGGVGRELLDVDAGLKALALGLEDHGAHVLVASGRAQRVGQVEPARDRQRVRRADCRW